MNTTATFSALAEPNRYQIVELLRQRPLPVGQIADRLKLQQPQVSKHLRVLSKAGLVEVRPLAQQRIYALRAEPLKELEEWVQRYKRLWDERMDRLEEIVDEVKRKERKK